MPCVLRCHFNISHAWMAINSDNQNKNSPTAQSVEDHSVLRWVVNISSILGNGVCDLLCCSITAKNLLVSASDYHRSLQVRRHLANYSCSYFIGNWQDCLSFAKWLMLFSAFSPSTGMSLNAPGDRCFTFLVRHIVLLVTWLMVPTQAHIQMTAGLLPPVFALTSISCQACQRWWWKTTPLEFPVDNAEWKIPFTSFVNHQHLILPLITKFH